MSDPGTEILQRFIASAPTSLLMLDQDLRNLQASPRWIQDWGEQSAEPRRHHYEACPYVLPHWKEAHQAALANEAVIRGVDRFVVKEEEHWALWEVVPWGEAGGARGIIIYAEDVTQRLGIIQSLDDSQKDLHFLLSQYSEAVCSCPDRSSRHLPTCWASPTSPLIARSESALRALSRVQEQLKVKGLKRSDATSRRWIPRPK